MTVADSPSPIELIVVGGTARAAGHSLKRLGLSIGVLDRFGDDDLPGQRLSHDFPLASTSFLSRDWPRIVAETKSTCWLYTGGWENLPRQLDRMSRHLPLCGNSAAVVNRVRDPRQLAEVLSQAGFPSAWNFEPQLPQEPTDWILKSPRSAGGLNVQRMTSSDPHAATRWARWRKQQGTIQRELQGTLLGANYIAEPIHDGLEPRRLACSLVGVCQALTSQQAFNAPSFGYCGSIGPVSVDAATSEALERLGHVLATAFDLRGVFGVDVMLQAGKLWTLEVNPRYTASMELLEWSQQTSVMARHLCCFDERTPLATPPSTGPQTTSTVRMTSRSREALPDRISPSQSSQRSLKGKAIQYVPDGCCWQVGSEFVRRARHVNSTLPWPEIADIPREGTMLHPGAPAFTVFAEEGPTASDIAGAQTKSIHEDHRSQILERQLVALSKRWWECLTEHSTGRIISASFLAK